MELLKKILIVDDEKFVTDALEGFFHSRGYKIFKAEDGQECLNLLKSESPDLVLLDIKLPKINGIEVLKLIRKDYPRIKVIIMTAYDMEYRTAVDNIGCDGFFVKPLLIDELTQEVEKLLSGEKRVFSSERKIKAVASAEGKKARILIISPRNLISDLVKEFFSKREACGGIYEVSASSFENGPEEIEHIKKFQPDIILIDVALVGMISELGVALMKLPEPPKEIVLFGDPADKWEDAEELIRRGTKFIDTPQDLHNIKDSVREVLERLNNAIREICAKYGLSNKEAD